MKDILIVVDMQKGFLQSDRTKELLSKVETLLNKNIFDVVIATRFLNADNSIFEKSFGWSGLKSEEEQKIPLELIKHIDYFEDKYIYNCVNSNFVQRLCQLNDGNYPEKIFIVGVDTECCVLTIATSLFESNIRPIVLSEYVDSNGGKESHIAGLIALRRLIGETQISSIKLEDKNQLKTV